MGRERKMPKGLWKRGNTYYARFRAGGRLVRKRLSSNYTAAVQRLNELKARADKADFDLLDNDYTWADLKAEFVKWVKQTKRRPETYECHLKTFEGYCPVRSVRQIDEQFVIGFRDWRLSQGKSRRTANLEVGTLRTMLSKAVAWGRIGSNPIAGVKPLKHDSPTKQRRSLTLEEVQAIFFVSPEYLRPVWRAFMCIGLRKSELVNLQFSDFDEERRVITVRAEIAKSHKAREIPLDDEIFATIKRLRDEASNRRPVDGSNADQTARQAANFSRQHMFVNKANTPFRNNLPTRFYGIRKRAGIEDAKRGGAIDIHALRVTFTTLTLEERGEPQGRTSDLRAFHAGPDDGRLREGHRAGQTRCSWGAAIRKNHCAGPCYSGAK